MLGVLDFVYRLFCSLYITTFSSLSLFLPFGYVSFHPIPCPPSSLPVTWHAQVQLLLHIRHLVLSLFFHPASFCRAPHLPGDPQQRWGQLSSCEVTFGQQIWRVAAAPSLLEQHWVQRPLTTSERSRLWSWINSNIDTEREVWGENGCYTRARVRTLFWPKIVKQVIQLRFVWWRDYPLNSSFEDTRRWTNEFTVNERVTQRSNWDNGWPNWGLKRSILGIGIFSFREVRV